MQNSSSEEWVKPTNIPKPMKDINSSGEFEIESMLKLLHDLESGSTIEEIEDTISKAYEEHAFLNNL
tara:strand:- start:896 stop:1096 length:201 start_codon:yes stop_codon:yes gene_type:complete